MISLRRFRNLPISVWTTLSLGAAILLGACSAETSGTADLASRTEARGRLVVVGLDALDWRLVDEMTRNGSMPNLKRILERGAGAVLQVPPPLLSPVVWTTIATGAPPQEHGVLDFLEQDPRDRAPRPVSSRSRKVPALWEMTAAAGRSTAVVGWWATYPAETIPRCAIYSDRLTEQLLGLTADTEGAASPPEAAASAKELQMGVDEVTPAMLAPFAPVRAGELEAVRAGTSGWEDPIGGLVRLVAATATVERITEHEMRRGTDVILTYLEGTDTVGHLFGAYRPPPMRATTPELAARFGGTVDVYYARVDAWLGRIAAALGPEDTLVIVSDHGFTWGEDRPPVASGARTPTAVWWHRAEGVFIVAGPAVRPTAQRARIGVLDVAPSLLALAGLPLDQSMKGSVPSWIEVERAAGSKAAPFDYRALLPRREGDAPELPSSAKEEELAKLRALGYLGGATGAAREVEPAGDRVEARRLNNEAMASFSEGNLDDAERGFRRAIAADPSYASAHYNLSLVHRRRGFFDGADTEFWKAVEHGIADPEMTVVRLALDYRERGDARRAAATFTEGRRRFPESAAIWLNSGVFLGEQGDYGGARKALERATRLDPRNAMAWSNLAIALAREGDTREARRAMTRASRLDPENGAVRRELARLGGPLD